MKTFVVQISDHSWTLQAMHLACSMARNTGGEVVLLRLMHVTSPYFLGFDLIMKPPTPEENQAIGDCATIAEDYGVAITIFRMQYTSFPEALVQAAEHLSASAIFARFPKRAIPFMHKIELWNVQRHLAACASQLYTLEQTKNGDHVPAISLKPVKR